MSNNSNIICVEILADGVEYTRDVNTDVCIVNQVEAYLASIDIFPSTLIINGEDVSSVMYETVVPEAIAPQIYEENDTY